MKLRRTVAAVVLVVAPAVVAIPVSPPASARPVVDATASSAVRSSTVRLVPRRGIRIVKSVRR